MAASPEKLREMGGRSKTLGRPDALKSIIDEIARVLCI
jgi:UDP-N-acetylglucosamine:LPS N-acetylglucosamine transferase